MLGVFYRDQGQYEQAEPLLISEQSLGPIHADVATRLENYVDLLGRIGRKSEVLPLEERVKAIRAK